MSFLERVNTDLDDIFFDIEDGFAEVATHVQGATTRQIKLIFAPEDSAAELFGALPSTDLRARAMGDVNEALPLCYIRTSEAATMQVNDTLTFRSVTWYIVGRHDQQDGLTQVQLSLDRA